MNAPLLENEHVKLTLLDLSNYTYLLPISSQINLVQYSPINISTKESLKDYVQTAVDNYYHNIDIPFIVYDKHRKSYAGTTRFMHIDKKNKVVEIGSTWIGREFQGTGLNKQMKFLMLQYAFENMCFEKVEFRIDERNIRSRKAVENLGAIQEGVLRKDILMLDGFRRSSCRYGILKEEWPQIKDTIFKGYF